MNRWRWAAVTLVLALVGCTPSEGVTPSPLPTPIQITPSESSLERRERLDFAAAENTYRTFQTGVRRVLREGGARKLPSDLLLTTSGTFRRETTKVVSDFHKLGRRQTGIQKIVFVRLFSHEDNLVILDVCEDGTGLTTYGKSGNSLGHNEIRRSNIRVEKIDGRWQLTSADGRKVSTCE